MLQRVQSLYLGIVCMVMVFFLRLIVPITREMIRDNGWHHTAVLLHGLSMGLVCSIIAITVYAIKRHDNRKFQLCLVYGILLLLLSLTLLNVLCLYIQQTSTWSCSLIALLMVDCLSVLAMYHIKKDEKLVDDDRLR